MRHPIHTYAVIGNCRSVALIAPDGSLDWGCLPDFDSPAVFCRIVDAQRGGYFQVAPATPTSPGVQRYLQGSNVLQTRFAGTTGDMVLTDFMPVETLSARQSPELPHALTAAQGCCLIRIVECTCGELEVMIRLKATPAYAAAASHISLLPGSGAVIDGGEHHLGLAVLGGHLLPTYRIALEQRQDELTPGVVIQATLAEGERLLCALGVASNASDARRLAEVDLPQRNVDAVLAQTLHCWRSWLHSLCYTGPYLELVERSALALKMMTYAPSGAVVAAATTSLPAGTHTRDQRLFWLRDAGFTLRAFHTLGFREEALAFTRWIQRLCFAEGEDLQHIYGLRGERERVEQGLPHLDGSRPVRIGHALTRRKQLDVFGSVLDCLYQDRRRKYGEHEQATLAGAQWGLMRMLAEHVCIHWQAQDSRAAREVYAQVMCWVALDRVIRVAEQEELAADLSRWRRVREQIRREVLASGYNAHLGTFTRFYGGSTFDAFCLQLPLLGFLPPGDPRMRSTVERVIKQLTDECGFVLAAHAEHGCGEHTGNWMPGSFWLVSNLALQGRVEEAHALFERLIGSTGHPGLFSQTSDTRHGTAPGNYPQTLTHIALLDSVQNLTRATPDTGRRDRHPLP